MKSALKWQILSKVILCMVVAVIAILGVSIVSSTSTTTKLFEDECGNSMLMLEMSIDSTLSEAKRKAVEFTSREDFVACLNNNDAEGAFELYKEEYGGGDQWQKDGKTLCQIINPDGSFASSDGNVGKIEVKKGIGLLYRNDTLYGVSAMSVSDKTVTIIEKVDFLSFHPLASL